MIHKKLIKIIKPVFDYHFKKTLIILFLLQIVVLTVELFFNYWHASSYTAFMAKDLDKSLIYFGGCVIAFLLEMFASTIGNFIKGKLVLYGRKNLYEFYTKRETISELACQRLSQDTGQFFDLGFNIAIDGFFALVKIPVYFFIICKVGNFYMAFFGIFYAIFSTLIVNRFSSRLQHIDYELESEEGKFRRDLVRKFDNGNSHHIKLDKVEVAYNKALNSERNLSYMQKTFNMISFLIKYGMPLSLYFVGFLNYSQFAQLVDGFRQLFKNSSYIIDNRKDIAKFQSTIRRIEELN